MAEWPAPVVAQWAAVSVAAVAHHPPMAPSILHHPTSPMATMTTWWPVSCARRRCGTRPRRPGQALAGVSKYKGIESLTHDAPDFAPHARHGALSGASRDREVDLGTVLDTPTTLAPEAELLDVGVVILDPGISAEEDEELVYPEVRKAEATFMATELAEVLAEQGGWGAVRVVPDDRQFSDLLVRGTILAPTGNLWS